MRPHAGAVRAVKDRPKFGSSEYSAELDLVYELAQWRDTPLDQVSEEFHIGLREVSRYLADVQVDKYEAGVDYGTTAAQHRKIQSGADIKHPISGKKTPIKTGRDAAAYVHRDNPATPWVRMASELLKAGVDCKMPASMESAIPAQSGFICFGEPFFIGMVGQAVRDAGYVSFRKKWGDAEPRPEESGPVLGKGFLPLTYAEGCPMHPADPAMHSVAAHVGKYVIKAFFDQDLRHPDSDRTVGEEADLLADNIGMWRFWAAVHTMSDHTSADMRAELVAKDLVRPYLR